ncbi:MULTISPECIES: hypothetical protein [Actinosynnema]|uniref:hypothetical protein n=1 Tax=Actinosynnema TaxID=40566 RepID=UPI0020A23F3E|nr:hypothetical protein [Actinosynnema pretiosum]MCP2095121.1 hypothetical protein [Actinosynnema pretiosum]
MTPPQEPHPSHPYSPAPPFTGSGPWEAPAPQVRRPSEVTAAFWVWVSGSALFTLLAASTLTAFDEIVDTVATARPYPGVSEAELVPLVTTALIAALVLIVVFAGLAALFAYHARLGKPWARVALTVLACIALGCLLLAATLPALVIALIPLVGAGALHTTKAKAYFAAGRYR